MWNKLLCGLSFSWSRLWSPLLAASLVAGFTYLLKRRDEKRELKKKLSTQLYIPVREQLSEAESPIRKFQRAPSVNSETWKKAFTTGVAGKLNAQLRRQLQVLYEAILPGYDVACQELNEEISRMREDWDSRFADVKDFRTLGMRATVDEQPMYNTVDIDWTGFLTEETPVLPLDGLQERDVLRLFNGFMTPARFKLLDQTVEQFLVERWAKGNVNPVMRKCRNLRRDALSAIPKAITLLSHEILY